MKYFEKISGERLYLSPMNIEDAETYTKWLNDKKIAENLSHSRIINLEFEREWIKKNRDYHKFAIVLRDSDKLIGNCGFDNIDPVNRTATLGIFIGDKEQQNKGYGREALKCLLNYGFNTLNLNNVMLTVFSFNERAIKTYKKLGFKTFGVRRSSQYHDGKFYDIVYMDILKSEFNEIQEFIFIS